MLRIKLEEVVYISGTEIKFLNTVIQAIEEYLLGTTANIPNIELELFNKTLTKFKRFHKNYHIEWKKIHSILLNCYQYVEDTKQFIANDKLVYEVKIRTKKLKSNSTIILSDFINELNTIINRSRASKNQIAINLALSYEFEYVNNPLNENNSKSLAELSDLIKDFKIFNESLSDSLETINPYNKNIFKSPDYSSLPKGTYVKAFEEYFNLYCLELKNYKEKIIKKLSFCYNNLNIDEPCKKIYEITNPPIKYSEYSHHRFFQNSDEDFILVLDFIKKNHDFFIAPYVDYDNFQSWCDENYSLAFSISYILQKIIDTTDQLQCFGDALKEYSKTNNDNKLARFISHPSNKPHMIPLLKKMINKHDKILDEFEEMPLQEICNIWREDMNAINNDICTSQRM